MAIDLSALVAGLGEGYMGYSQGKRQATEKAKADALQQAIMEQQRADRERMRQIQEEQNRRAGEAHEWRRPDPEADAAREAQEHERRLEIARANAANRGNSVMDAARSQDMAAQTAETYANSIMPDLVLYMENAAKPGTAVRSSANARDIALYAEQLIKTKYPDAAKLPPGVLQAAINKVASTLAPQPAAPSVGSGAPGARSFTIP